VIDGWVQRSRSGDIVFYRSEPVGAPGNGLMSVRMSEVSGLTEDDLTCPATRVTKARRVRVTMEVV